MELLSLDSARLFDVVFQRAPSWMCQIECSLGELKEGNTRHWENLGDEALKKCECQQKIVG